MTVRTQFHQRTIKNSFVWSTRARTHTHIHPHAHPPAHPQNSPWLDHISATARRADPLICNALSPAPGGVPRPMGPSAMSRPSPSGPPSGTAGRHRAQRRLQQPSSRRWNPRASATAPSASWDQPNEAPSTQPVPQGGNQQPTYRRQKCTEQKQTHSSKNQTKTRDGVSEAAIVAVLALRHDEG